MRNTLERVTVQTVDVFRYTLELTEAKLCSPKTKLYLQELSPCCSTCVPILLAPVDFPLKWIHVKCCCLHFINKKLETGHGQVTGSGYHLAGRTASMEVGLLSHSLWYFPCFSPQPVPILQHL